MAMRRQRRDAVTEEEIAAFHEANHQFGNDNARIAVFMAGRDDITVHARQIYRGNRRGVTNRLNVVRRTIRRGQLVRGHLPPNENRRDDRFAYDYDRLQNHQGLRDEMQAAENNERADPVANQQEENRDDDQPEAENGAAAADEQLPRGGLRQLQVENQLLLRRVLQRFEERLARHDRLTELMENYFDRLERPNQERDN